MLVSIESKSITTTTKCAIVTKNRTGKSTPSIEPEPILSDDLPCICCRFGNDLGLRVCIHGFASECVIE